MQPKTSAVVYSTLSFTPLLAWLVLLPIAEDHVPFGLMILFAIGFLITSVLTLVGGVFALVFTYHQTPPPMRRGFAITATVFFALPWCTWLILVANG